MFGSGEEFGVYGNGAIEGVHAIGTARGLYAFANEIGVLGDAYIYGVYGQANGTGVRGQGSTYGVFSAGPFGGNNAKYFVEPHPTDPTKEIRFVCLEGPESGTYFRGSSRTVNGVATIVVPGSFRMVSDEANLTVVVTPVGELAMMACMEKSLDRIVIRSSKDVEFDYVVNGVRKALADHQAISENIDFVPRSPTDLDFTKGLPTESLRRLKANGILNDDGTIRMDTAERLGWTERWAERERPVTSSTR